MARSCNSLWCQAQGSQARPMLCPHSQPHGQKVWGAPWAPPGWVGVGAELLLGSSCRSHSAAEPGMCQTPLCQNLNEGDGAALGVTATGLCLQMELLAQPSASGRGLGC